MRAAQETLGCRSWVTALQQTFPGPPLAVRLLKKGFYNMVGGASSPAVQSLPGNIAPAVWGPGDPGFHQGSACACIGIFKSFQDGINMHASLKTIIYQHAFFSYSTYYSVTYLTDLFTPSPSPVKAWAPALEEEQESAQVSQHLRRVRW